MSGMSLTGEKRSQGPLKIVDTSIRDGNQSLWGATGITTGMAEAMAPIYEQMGLEALDFTSSTHMVMGTKFHGENPWERISRVRAAAPNTHLSCITTGMRFMSWEKAEESVYRMSLRVMARHGLSRIMIAEPNNDIEQTMRVARWAKEEGISNVLAAVVYTISPVHTDEKFLAATKAYAKCADIDSVYLKDPGGLLTAERTKELVPKMRTVLGKKRFELHSHCTTGAAPHLYLVAAELGIDVLHTGMGPLSNGTAQPSLEHLLPNLDALGIVVDVNRDAAAEGAALLWDFARAQKLSGGTPNEYDLSFHRHQVPGGMMGTMKRQLAEIGMSDALPAVIDEASRVRADLGYPIMVTPFSQFVGSQALMNVLAEKSGQERYSRIPDEVVKFVAGDFGSPEGEILPEILQRVADSPRAAELKAAKRERTLEELHTEYTGKFGKKLSEEDLLLRIVMPHDQAEIAINAAPAPAWTSGARLSSSTGAPQTVQDFINSANSLPTWKHLSVDRDGAKISLTR
jgi:oxaloacetate decarboxylase (Na+ extruding) subunit alpha